MKQFKVSYAHPGSRDLPGIYFQIVDADSASEAHRLTEEYLHKNGRAFDIVSIQEWGDAEAITASGPVPISTILDEVHDIIYVRNSEKEKQYGPFNEGMQRAAQIWSGMTGKDLTARDMYLALVALKLSRESYNPKYDNILDMLAYIVGMYENQKDEYDETK